MEETGPAGQQIDRTYLRVGRRRLSYFGGCDYFRLASHPRILQAMVEGLDRYGLNVAASRKTTGNHEVYERLERALAVFFGVESAALLSNGYIASLAAAQGLAGEFTHVLIDDRAHGALSDAARFFDCPVRRFPHRDVAAAEQAIHRCGKGAKIILLTDGMFSHNGEFAPLAAYLSILPRSGMILLDDAHGAGTLGRTGQGTPEHLGTPTDRMIRAITLSKAFGVYGGAIVASRAVRNKIVARSSIFIGNTPLPLPLAHAARQSLKVVRQDAAMRRRLDANTIFVKGVLRRAGLPLADTPSPIVPLIPRNPRQASRLQQELLARGVFPTLIQYPGGPVGGYFRFALSSEHRREQLEDLLAVLLPFAERSRGIGGRVLFHS